MPVSARLHARSGMTMLEMIVAVAIFSTAVVVALEFMASSRRFVDGSVSRENLRLEGRRILSALATDIGNSAWFLEYVEDKSTLLAGDDRDLRYYPYVHIQQAGLRGSRFQAHHRSDDMVLSSDDFSEYDFPLPHTLPSQELVFLKVAKGTDGETPQQLSYSMVNFNEPAIPMEDYYLGERAASLALTDLGSGQINADLTWEKQASSGAMREYSYVVVPADSGGGRGQLERRYHHRSDITNGSGSTVTDRVLSRNVDRLLVDTYRTTTGLSVDQIRITVYMSRVDERDQLHTHTASITVAMRSTVDPEYSASIDDWLGDAGNEGFLIF